MAGSRMPLSLFFLAALPLCAAHYEILWDGNMCTFSQKSGDRQITRKNLKDGRCLFRIPTGREGTVAGFANADEAYYDGEYLVFSPLKKSGPGRSEFLCRETE